MNIRKRLKNKLKLLPRYSDHQATKSRRPRKNATYFSDWCCSQCYWDWGRGWDGHYKYRHNCAKSNYDGLLKKYWKPTDNYKDNNE